MPKLRVLAAVASVVLVSCGAGISSDAPTTSSTALELTPVLTTADPFVPASTVSADRASMDLMFVDGTTATIEWPADLDLMSLGVRPEAVAFRATSEGPDGRWLAVYHATVDSLPPEFGQRELLGEYDDGAGGTVGLWRFEGWEWDYLTFQFGRWLVLVYDYRNSARMTEEERALWARSLHGDETAEGFLLLDADEPLAVGGPGEQFGEYAPVIAFRSPQGWLRLKATGCEPGSVRGELGDGDGYAEWCDPSGRMLVRIEEATEEFQQAVLKGLEVRDVEFASRSETVRAPDVSAIPLSSGVVDRSGFGVGAGSVEIPLGAATVSNVPGLFVTEDAGRSWVDVTPPQQPTWVSVSSIEFLDRNQGFVFLNDPGVQATLAATNNGGASWAAVASFPSLFHAGDTVQLQFTDERNGWMYSYVPPATGCAILKETTDGGTTWDLTNQCLPDAGEIRLDADGTGWLGGTPFFTAAHEDSLHRTDDGGRTWTEIRVALPDGHDPFAAIYDLPVFFADRGLLAVTMSDGPTETIVIYSTLDRGFTWDLDTIVYTTGSTSLEKKLAAGVAFASQDIWWIAVAGINGADIMVTTDGGDSWRANSDGPPGSVLEVQAFDDQTAWITTNEGLFATFDGGRTWKRLQSELSTTSRP